MDPILLARIHSAPTSPFTSCPDDHHRAGLVLLFFKLRFRATGRQAFMDAYFFFVKVFALSFALGVVSGITMSFQFGTNWPASWKRSAISPSAARL